MKTLEIVVSNNGTGMNAALAQADRMAEHLNLKGKDALHMRLLVEEMMCLIRSVVGRLEGKFWIELTDDAYKLHLRTVTLLDDGQRAQLLASSSSGKNEAHRGLMGKIRAFFEPMRAEDAPPYLGKAIVSSGAGDVTWSLDAYRERLRQSKATAGEARQEWDELEKSVVSHIADNVQVSIRGSEVELVIEKKLNR